MSDLTVRELLDWLDRWTEAPGLSPRAQEFCRDRALEVRAAVHMYEHVEETQVIEMKGLREL